VGSILDPYSGAGPAKPRATAPARSPAAIDEAAELKRMQTLAKLFAGELQKAYITAALPAHNEPHWFSTPVDVSGRVNVPAAVGGWQTICTYKVEAGRKAFIRQYGVDVQDGAYTYNGSLRWQVTVNGVIVPTLGSFAEHRGAVATPRSTFIKLQEADIVALSVMRAVAAAAPQDVDGVLVGWTIRPRRDYDGALASIAH
jgi:hypothetical protein